MPSGGGEGHDALVEVSGADENLVAIVGDGLEVAIGRLSADVTNAVVLASVDVGGGPLLTLDAHSESLSVCFCFGLEVA